MLEEAIQICEQMWSDDNGPFTGKHYQFNYVKLNESVESTTTVTSTSATRRWLRT